MSILYNKQDYIDFINHELGKPDKRLTGIDTCLNNDIAIELINGIDIYLNEFGSEFMSDFYSQICDTNITIGNSIITINDSKDECITAIIYKDIDKLKDEVYSFVLKYLLQKYNENIIEHLKLIGKLK